jgi:hypothetical protein
MATEGYELVEAQKAPVSGCRVLRVLGGCGGFWGVLGYTNFRVFRVLGKSFNVGFLGC